MRCLVRFFFAYLLIGNTEICFAQQLPIIPARTISFTTDEGTYMNVDVSPDGNTLLFDLLGDLYSLPVTGGIATQLTRGIALNLRPVWSPDGKRIAYISDISGDFHLNVRDISGKFHTVLGRTDDALDYGLDAIWTPDGNYIVIDDFIYGLAGGKISTEDDTKHLLRFSPNRQLIYGVDSGRLYVYDRTTKIKTSISPELRGFRSGILSSNNRWWCYITDSSFNKCLIIQDLINNTSRVLVPSLIENDPRYQLARLPFPHYSFSPDSKSVFIGYGGKIHCICIEDGIDRIIPFVANVKSDLGSFNYNTFRVSHDSVKVKYTRSANLSPDGKHVIFSTFNKVYIKDLPNGSTRVLTPQAMSQFQPVYSPDGQWIAYVSWCDTAGGYLWRVHAFGGQPEQLSFISGQYQQPTWSRDGRLIAVIKGFPRLGDRDDPGSGQLELIPVNGGIVRVIEDSVPIWNKITFSSDGNRIMYKPKYERYGKGPLNPQLVSKDLAGENLHIIVVDGSITANLQQMSVSPDGRFIVYSTAEDLYLVPVNMLTNPQIIYDQKKRSSVIKFAQGVDPYWEKGGKMLSWCYGNRFYSVNPDKIIESAEKQVQKPEATRFPNDRYYISSPIIPDQVVNLDVAVPSFYAHGTIAFRNVRVITMKGDKVIEHGTIIVRDGRVAAVGPTNMVPVPAGAKLLDLTGTTIMPGLVDIHLHTRIPSNIFPQQSWMFLANFAYGITTARDPSLSFDSYGYKELLESGQMIGPRLYTVGRPARISDGMIACDNIDDARSVVHKRELLGGTVIKQYSLPTRLQRQWLLMACREAGLNMTNEGASDPISQIGMIKDGSTGIEHNPVWGNVHKDVISFVAASGIYLTPTLQVCDGAEMGKEYFKYKYWHQPDKKLIRFVFSDSSQKGPKGNGAESIEAILNTHSKDTLNPGFITPSIIDARIRKQGGRVTLGSHGNDEGIGTHNELWALQMGGISNMEALQAATIMGAEAIGIQKDVGSIEVGKIADLIILNKNPLEDIHNSREIRFVMKDGVLYDGDTLDTIWPMVKKCPEWKLKVQSY